MENIIKLGTSGYSFEDWKGVFYPDDIDKGKMLDYYSKHFNTVEINSTYYKIPHSSVFYWLSEKTEADFEFIVKVHKEITHERKGSFDSLSLLLEALKPLIESGKFKGFLAQFPWSFKYSISNIEYIKKIKDNCNNFDIWVEFRNAGWVRDNVFEFLQKNKIGYCCVDEPRLRGLILPQAISTTDTGYVRFHGRNTATWWDSSAGDRYDYLYTKEELSEWIEKIRELRKQTSKTYLFFLSLIHI